jgi:amidohydrolase
MTINIRPEIDLIKSDIIAIRRDIHMHPEIGFEVHRTASLVADCLKQLDMEVKENVGTTGVMGTLYGSGAGPTIALRADMDALPIQEISDIPYKSVNNGAMHACGHDGHTAMLLGTAKALAAIKHKIHGNVRFIFQPAEEKGGGARYMIKDGCLDHVDEIFGVHLWNYEPFGIVGSVPGPMLASTDTLHIRVQGTGGHGGVPQGTVDAIVVSAHLITTLQTIVSRSLDPVETAVLTIGTIHGGNGYNVIADTVEMNGTIRTFSPKIRQQIQERIIEIIKGIQDAFKATIEINLEPGYPITINHKDSFEKLIKAASAVVGNGARQLRPFPGGEDFSYYLKEIPGCFFFVGSSPPDIVPGSIPHHCSRFDIDERALLVGSSVIFQLIENLLVHPAC